MANITGTIVDQVNKPLANAFVTLIGAAAPQVTLTDINGKFSFASLADGDYKIFVGHKDYDQQTQQLVRLTSGVDTTGLLLQLDSEVDNPCGEDDKYKRLKYAQYFFLMLVGSFYFFLVAYGVWDVNVDKLKNLESARGIITYFVAVTTIAMAALLMLAAIMTGGKDLDKRFALGKEILTLLIGVLGTIIGFYYGATATTKLETNTTESSTNTTAIKVSGVSTNPASPIVGKPFSVNANIEGGTSPYNYSLTVAPTGTANPVLGKLSADGKVNETLTVQDNAKPGSATLTVSGKDAKSTSFTASAPISITK